MSDTLPANTKALTRAGLVPYITSWTGERRIDSPVVLRGRWGIGYHKEVRRDRDSRGVLWVRNTRAPGEGEPEYRQVHPLRQRHAMRRLLCQVCGGPADTDERGTLWLLGEADQGWSGDDEQTGQPPVCLRCAVPASRACPHLRGNTLALRVGHAPLVGVFGQLYWPGRQEPVLVGPATLKYGDPRIGWLQASQLMRGLYDCTVVDLGEEAGR